MRVLIVSQRYYPLVGGAERMVRALAAEFVRFGCDVRVVTARFDRSWPTQEEIDGVPLTRLPLPTMRFVGTACYVTALRHHLRTTAATYDLVYVSMLKHSAWAAVTACRSLGRPVVLRAEGAGQTGDVAWQRKARFGRIIAAACRTADAIIAPSSLVRTELLDAGYDAGRVHLIRNAVCCRMFRPPSPAERQAARLRWGLEGPVIGYIGRLAPEKGLEELLAAWPEVRRRHRSATLLIAGGPPDAPAARCVGRLDGALYVGELGDPRQMLHALDFFVLPSRFEGISIALLEAMACGVVPLTSRIEGNCEVLGEPGHCGLMFRSGAPLELAEAVCEALESTVQQWNDWSEAARRRVCELFNLEQNAQRHLELFESLCAGHRAMHSGDRCPLREAPEG